MGDNLPPIDFGISTRIDTKIRLVDGTKMRGRVQVFYQTSWRDVCDDSWNDANAQVVCRQLGLAGGTASILWNGTGDFGMDEVACSGFESQLGHCSFRGWGIHDCRPHEAAGVECHLDAWSVLPNPNISARRGHSAVWDANSSSMLIFAGHAAGSFQYFNDLWRYQSPDIWQELQVVGPSPRGAHAAVWDSRSRTMLVFGGSHFMTHFDDLWLYHSTNNTWTLLSPSVKPTARAFHSAIWDAVSQIMLVFAGENGVNLEDLWKYHLTSNSWTELLPSSEKPPARSRHSAVWIEASAGMLMFGGWSDTALNDLWHFGLWTNTWIQILPIDPPSPCAGHTAIWDPVSWSMLTFGGVQLKETLGYTAEMWSYSLLTNTRTPLAPVGPYPSPEPREDHATAWDPESRFLYLLGGFDVTYKSDFWRYKALDLAEIPVTECFIGQEILSLCFESSGFQPGDIIRAVGTPSTVSFETLEIVYDPTAANYTFLLMEPGLYRISHCSHVNSVCEGHWFDFGFLLVAGPFSDQSFVCNLGSRCVVRNLQGFRLSEKDQLLPLRECGTALPTSTFDLEPTSGASDMSTDVIFDFGDLQLEDLAPEQLQLCWCPSDCNDPEDFRALAMLLYVVCPPGEQTLRNHEPPQDDSEIFNNSISWRHDQGSLKQIP
eukprot:Skav207542  [mRNA]  locus=scaffold2063:27753:29729:+ [translate_table: standard]